MLSLQLSRLVPRFYQTNDHSLKQMDSRASAWLGPPGGGGGVHPLVFIRQSAGTQFRLRSPDVTRSHAGLFCAAAATELRKSGCTEVLLSQLVVEAESVIISV